MDEFEIVSSRQGDARHRQEMDGIATSLIEWSAAARTRQGESESGDAYTVTTVPHGVLLAVADGLGHGVAAAQAARSALDVVGTSAFAPLPLIIHDCHRALRYTRGVVMSLALFDGRRPMLWWLGVGNVAGYLVHPGASDTLQPLMLRKGVVGQRVPPSVAASFPLTVGDTLIVVSDGVKWRPGEQPVRLEAPAAMARHLLDGHATGEDDAVVVVARYLGPRS